MSHPDRATGPRPDEFTVSALFTDQARGGPLETVSFETIDAWTWKLGPTSTLLWLYLARVALVGETGGSAVVKSEEVRDYLGVQSAVLWRSMDRLQYSTRVRWLSGDVLGVEVISKLPKPRLVPSCTA